MIVRRSAVEEVADLKQQPGKDMLIWGSISLAQALLKQQLIDEYRPVLCLLVVGSGRPLFDDKIAINMKLLDVKVLDLGAVSLKYALATAVALSAARI